MLTRLESLLRAIATMSKAGDYSGNATMQQYLGWEKNKKAAVDAGALEDPGATGLGAAMEAVEKAEKEAAKATKPDEKTSTGKAALAAWDQLIRAANAVQALTENANFSSYLESCVTQATAARNNHPAP